MPNWHEVFGEIQALQSQAQSRAITAPNVIRLKYLTELHKHTGRNVIAYYSGWLSKGSITLSDINDEDKNGFMTTVHKLDRKLGLDLILHTPGGGIAATHSIVNYLQKMFGRDIRAIIPQIAMSAGTILACCCKEIWMGKESNLGPIDPQLRGIPAHGAVQEFNRALREVKKDPSRLAIWQQIIGQYRPTFLGQCENAIKWSNEFVVEQLAEGMLKGSSDPKKKAKQIAKSLADYRRNKSHDRHLDAVELGKMGLKIKALEDDSKMQDLVLTVHHCYMHVLMNTPAFKIIENHTGVAMVKQSQTPTGLSPARRPSSPPSLCSCLGNSFASARGKLLRPRPPPFIPPNLPRAIAAGFLPAFGSGNGWPSSCSPMACSPKPASGTCTKRHTSTGPRANSNGRSRSTTNDCWPAATRGQSGERPGRRLHNWRRSSSSAIPMSWSSSICAIIGPPQLTGTLAVERKRKSNRLNLNGLLDRLGLQHFEPAVILDHPNQWDRSATQGSAVSVLIH